MQKRESPQAGVRKLGTLEVSSLGLGCMGMSQGYGTADEAESLRVLETYLELGGNFLDTADAYGPHTNEELIGKFLRAGGSDRREKIVLATKFGLQGSSVSGEQRVNGTPEYVRAACEASLKRLGTDHIDLYYLHRLDPETPIEDTIGAMRELVLEGLVRQIGLSEVSAATLRRAQAVHPIAALQSEYSLWTREIESDVLPTLRELGIGLVPFSPLGRGFLSGELKHPNDLSPNDFRRNLPRFQGEHFFKNLELVEAVKTLALERGVTPGQFALAWVMSKGEDFGVQIVPIPGTKRVSYLQENMLAASVMLSAEERLSLESVFPVGAISGERYGAANMKLVDG
jgi:aryl-alcohol dehydrogenase-like predicted oxidoreductase